MYLKYLNIQNFRAVNNAELFFDKGINFLIGKNNIGKSSILMAIDFLLNPYIQWWRNDILSEFDFWRRNTEKNIIIEAHICCGYKTCCGEDDSCPYFEVGLEDNFTNCKLSNISLIYDTTNVRNPFPNIEELDQTENFELAIRIRMTAVYQPEENFVKVKHEIWGNDGEWHSFTRSMKEFIGANLFTTIRQPDSNFRLQYNSLLLKIFKNMNKSSSKLISHFKNELNPIIEDIYNEELKDFFEGSQDLLHEFPDNASINLGLGKVRINDILKQVELNLKYLLDDVGEEFKVPLSLQGRGLQNLIFLFMCSRIQSIQLDSPKIFIIEEPEQNLEPQRQRSVIKIIKNLVNDDTQIIITTHSPYILTLNKDLSGVKKLIKNEDDKLEFIDLGNIVTPNNKKFNQIRKNCDSDFELFESLFSNFIVLWEGDCELSFYTTLMRNMEGYPSEWLIGINCQGDNTKNIASWLDGAGYKLIAVLDGDKPDFLEDLKKLNISFIALKEGEKFEHLVENCLCELNEEEYSEALIKMIGSKGYIGHEQQIMGKWEAFKTTFESFTSHLAEIKEKYRFKIDTEEFLNKFKEENLDDPDQKPQDTIYILEQLKEKRAHETLAEFIVEKQIRLDIVTKLLDKLKNVFLGVDDLGFYQLSENDEFEIL